MASNPDYFQTRFAPDARREKLWGYLARYLQQFIPADAAVLELGAGYCYFVNAVSATRRVAVDLSDTLALRAAAGVEPVSADALAYLRGAAAGQFDFILASNFFEHFEWPALNEMIGHIVRVLRPGGRLAVIQPNFRIAAQRYFDDYTHRAIFTDVSMNDWLAASGLHVVVNVPRFLPLTVKSRCGGLSFLVPIYLRLPWRPLAGQMFVLAERGM